MIVNHGDNLLNIYFTTPLIATCFQENDPVYQKSEFNNFNRIDTYDSDLWNNTECFTNDEVFEVLKTKLQSEKVDIISLNNTIADQKVATTIPIFYLKMIEPKFLENDWLNEIFPKPIQWIELESFPHLANTPNPILLFQAKPGDRSMPQIYNVFVNELEKLGKTMTILHLSDEYGADPIEFYNSKAVRQVIRNYPRSDISSEARTKTLVIPLGYAKGCGSVSKTPTLPFSERPYVWSFAGSMDRQGRATAIQLLQKPEMDPYAVEAKPTWSDPAKLIAPDYTTLMRKTKFVPCFAGFRALESYRLYEALEQGAIPFYVPDGVEKRDTYNEVLGNHPILSFPTWERVAEILPTFLKNPVQMEEHRMSLINWWNTKKSEIRTQIQNALS
jgi:hypothetical protein